MNRIHTFFLLSLLLVSSLWAQVPTNNYFPADLMKSEGIKSYMVFETQIDDPVAQSGKANRIRLAKNTVRQAYFDREGLLTRTVWLSSDGKFVQREWKFGYDSKGQKIIESQKYFHTNNSDSTKVLQTVERQMEYGAHGELLTKNAFLRSKDESVHTDSVAYNRNEAHKLIEEISIQVNDLAGAKMTKKYTYGSESITVLTLVNDQTINRDEYTLDKEGRLSEAKFFTADETEPRMKASYQFHPRGWLEEINYTHNWDFFKKEETVISQKNRYDDHGKLFETQKDYGTGKRLFEFYDYSYFVN